MATPSPTPSTPAPISTVRSSTTVNGTPWNILHRIWLWGIIGLITIFLITVAVILIQANVLLFGSPALGNAGWTIIAIIVLYYVLSFKALELDKLGAVKCFGAALYEVNPGLVFVPFGLCQLEKETALVQEIHHPGRPEDIDKSGDDKKPQEGKVRPLRIPTASFELVDQSLLMNAFGHDDPDKAVNLTMKDLGNDSLKDRLTVEQTIVIRYRIRRGEFIQFLRNIGSKSMAEDQLRDIAEKVTRREFARRTPSLITLQQKMIDNEIKTAVEELVGDKDSKKALLAPDEKWGIDVLNAYAQEPDWSKKVNTSFAQTTEQTITNQRIRSKAQADRDAKVIEADGRQVYLTKEGTGTASARESFLIAEATGLAETAKVALTEAGLEALRLKTALETFKGEGNKVVVTPSADFGSLLGALMAGKKALDETAGSPTPTPPTTPPTSKTTTPKGVKP